MPVLNAARDSTPTELALTVRLLQMYLREAGQAVAGGVLGQDQLVPLLEPLIVVARPLNGWTLLARMQALGGSGSRVRVRVRVRVRLMVMVIGLGSGLGLG